MTTKITAAASKKTAPRKAAASKTVAAAAEIVGEQVATSAKKKAARKPVAMPVIPPNQRHRLIELAAYYLSERRGFTGVSSDEDWLQAEQDVDALIVAGHFTA